MSIDSIQKHIIKTQDQIIKYRKEAKYLKQETDLLEEKISNLKKSQSLDVSVNLIVRKQKLLCRGTVRIIYELMKKENRPISASEIYKITKINKNTISGNLRIGYIKKGYLDKVGEGLYQINDKRLKLLEVTADYN